MAKSVIPTLNINDPVLESGADKMIYLLKFLMYNPGWTSSWYENRLLSMRRSMAQYTENADQLVPALENFLTEVIRKYYPSYSCSIKTTFEDDAHTKYSMDIAIRDGAGNIVISLDKIKSDNTNLFIYKGV